MAAAPEELNLPVAPAGVPMAQIGKFELGMVLRSALSVVKHPSPYGPVIALHFVDQMLAAARVQQVRIAHAKRRSDGRRFKGNTMLFADVHFYLICWARIAKLVRFIYRSIVFSRSTKFKRTGFVLKRYRKHLDEKIVARDYMEHLEENLPGEHKHKMLKVPNDMMNFFGGHLTFGGDRFDIGPASCQRLVTFIDEFQKAVLFDAIELLATRDPKRLKSVVRQSVSTLRVARILK